MKKVSDGLLKTSQNHVHSIVSLIYFKRYLQVEVIDTNFWWCLQKKCTRELSKENKAN